MLFVTQHDAIELAIAGKKQGCSGAGPTAVPGVKTLKSDNFECQSEWLVSGWCTLAELVEKEGF